MEGCRDQRQEGAGQGGTSDLYGASHIWHSAPSRSTPLHQNSGRPRITQLKTRGVPRDGAALLHGIAWCGECGHKMVVRYVRGSEYVCTYLQKQQGAPVCQRLQAARIDDRVATAFLEAVAPAEMDAWSEARIAERQAGTALRHAEAQQVERLRYQASLAERQFNRVDPDNRLVAAELERRWEAALSELRHAETALARQDGEASKAGPAALDPVLRAQALALQRAAARALGRPGRQPRAPQGTAALSD